MHEHLTRRDFGKLSAAAFGGLVAGAGLQGCGKGDPAPTGAAKNACRGLNECKGLGLGGKNDCAGQSACATVAHHDCGGQNDCKYQGGCGTTPGANDCKGKGGCGVPMSHGDAWERARAAFEKRMAAGNKKVGAAPAKQ